MKSMVGGTGRLLVIALLATLSSSATPRDAAAADVCTSPTGNLGYRYRVETSLGDFEIELCRTDNQVTVDNFISYIDDGSYGETGFIHRSVRAEPGVSAIDIVQGGGFEILPGPAIERIPRKEFIPLNSILPNLRGTLAMARTDDPDSASSEWFLNVLDNAALDPVGGDPKTGFTVFGQVISGMATVDAMAAVPTYDMGGMPFTDLPLEDGWDAPGASQLDHLIYIERFVSVPEPGGAVQCGAMLLTLAALARSRRCP